MRSPARLRLLTLAALSRAPIALAPGPPRPPAPASLRWAPSRTLALDAKGLAWGWAAPRPQTFATSFLVSFGGGNAGVATESTRNPALLPPGLHMTRLAVTAAGDDGWGIGAVGEGDSATPMLWRLDKNGWRVARNSFAPTLELLDLTLSGDGREGWITVYDRAISAPACCGCKTAPGTSSPNRPPARSRRSRSVRTARAAGRLAQRPDAAGQCGPLPAQPGRWVAVPGNLYPLGDVAEQVVADNAGNGWLITNAIHHDANGRLIRLTRSAAPRAVPLAAPPPAGHAGAILTLTSLALDGLGRGWVSGAFALGVRPDPINPQPLYRPVLARLRGDAATPQPNSAASFLRDDVAAPDRLAAAPNGAYSVVAMNGGGFGGFADLTPLAEPWPHDQPLAAFPLPGGGRCFDAVPNCLRGVFAAYWAAHGGLEQFGYPITPEIREDIGVRQCRVTSEGPEDCLVQYTQRARLEWHPEFRGTEYEVLLGLLGNTLANPRRDEAPFRPAPAAAGATWFRGTEHNIAPPFLAYWQANGGLPVLGLPRSEAFDRAQRHRRQDLPCAVLRARAPRIPPRAGRHAVRHAARAARRRAVPPHIRVHPLSAPHATGARAVTAVTFDFHNTLVSSDSWLRLEIHMLPGEVLTRLVAAGRLPPEAATPAMLARAEDAYHAVRERAKESGRETPALAGVVQVLATLGWLEQVDIADLKAALVNAEQGCLRDTALVPGALAVLADLRAQGVRLAVVSSAAFPPFVGWGLARHGLARYFPVIATSGAVGYYKSDPRLYTWALARLGVAPAPPSMWGTTRSSTWWGRRRRACGPSGSTARRWTAPTPTLPADCRPDAVIRALSDLPAALARLSGAAAG